MPNTRKVEVPVSARYREFVEPETGIIAQIFGEPSYQLQVSGPIDDGNSFQLGAFLAHALLSAGCLAQNGEAADTILWATGEVGADRAIGRVDEVALKWRQSAVFWEEMQRAGKSVILCVSPDAETRKELNEAGVPDGVRVEACLDVINLLERLGFQVPPDFWDLNRAWTKNPYPGLTRFTTGHRPVFAGRLTARAELLDRLAKLRTGDAPRPFLAITGDSGVGKSSILWAGLLGDLEDRERADGHRKVTWMAEEVQIQQGDLHALAALGAALAALVRDMEQAALELNEAGSSPIAALKSALAAFIPDLEPAVLDGLELEVLERGATVVGRTLAEACTRDPGPITRLVLVIDPLDRLLVEKGKAGTATRLAAALRGLIRGAGGSVIVLATVRSELAGHLGGGGVFSGLGGGDHIYNLAAPTPTEYREIIEVPARSVGWSLEEGMAERLAAEAARRPNALPLLQELLRQRYEAGIAAGARKLLTLGGEALDMLAGVIAETAEGAWRGVDNGGREAALDAALVGLLARLVVAEDGDDPAAGKAPVTRAIPLAELAPGSTERRLAEALREARLLVSEHRLPAPGAADEGSGGTRGEKASVTYITLAHDSLLSHWPRASKVLRDRWEAIRDLRMVNEAFGKWRKGKGRLLQTPELQRAQNLCKMPAIELDAPLVGFIKKSGRRLWYGRSAVAAAFVVVLGLAAWVAWTNDQLGTTIADLEVSRDQEAQRLREAQVNESLALVAQAEGKLKAGDWNEAVRLIRDALPDPRKDFADRPLVREAAALALELLARPGFRIQHQPMAAEFHRHVQFIDGPSKDIIIADDEGVKMVSNTTSGISHFFRLDEIRNQFGEDYQGYDIIGAGIIRINTINSKGSDIFYFIDPAKWGLKRIPFESPPSLLASPPGSLRLPKPPPSPAVGSNILGEVLAVSGDGNIVAVRIKGKKDIISIWSNKDWRWMPHKLETDGIIKELALSYRGRLVAVAYKYGINNRNLRIDVFNVRNMENLTSININDSAVKAPGMTIAENGGVVAVNTESGSFAYVFQNKDIQSVIRSVSGSVLSCIKVSDYGDSLVLNVNGSAAFMHNFKISNSYATSIPNICKLLVSSNGLYLAVEGFEATYILDVINEKQIVVMDGTYRLGSSASFSPDSDRIALAGKDQVEVLSLRSLAQHYRSLDLKQYLGNSLSNTDELRFDDGEWHVYSRDAPSLPATRFSVDLVLKGDGLDPQTDFDRCRLNPEQPQEGLIVFSCFGTHFQLRIGRTPEREHDGDKHDAGQLVETENTRLIAFLLADETKLYLANLGDNEIRLVQTAPLGYKIGILGFSPDGRKLSTLCRQAEPNGQSVRDGRASPLTAVKLGCYNTVTIRDTASAEIVGKINGEDGAFTGFGFTADSKYYYTSFLPYNIFSLFDASSGKRILDYEPALDTVGGKSGIYSSAISPFGDRAVIYHRRGSDYLLGKGAFFSFDPFMMRAAAALGLTVTFDQTGVKDVRGADGLSRQVALSNEARQLIEIFDLIALEPRPNFNSSPMGAYVDLCGLNDQFVGGRERIKPYVDELITNQDVSNSLVIECRDAMGREPDNTLRLAGHGFYLSLTSADPTEGLAELQRAIDLGEPRAPGLKWFAMTHLGGDAFGTDEERLELLAEACKRGDQYVCTVYLAEEYWETANAADESQRQTLRGQAMAVWRHAASTGDAMGHVGLAKASAAGEGVSPERMREEVLYHHLMAVELFHSNFPVDSPWYVLESRAKANLARTMFVEGQLDDLLRIAHQARADAQAMIRQQRLVPGGTGAGVPP